MIPKPPGWPRSPSLRLLPNLLCLQVSNPSTEAVHPPATPRARQSDQRCGRPCVYPGGTTRGRKRALRLRRLFFLKWLPGSLGTRAVVPRRGAEWCLTHWDGCRTEDGAARPRPGRNLQAAQEYGSQQGAGARPGGWGTAGVNREPCKAGVSCALGLPGLAVGGLRGELWVQVALLCL